MATLARTFHIADQQVGGDAAPLFLPDIGTFFNTDTGLALEMLVSLKDAGVTVVKGEILHRIDLCLDDDTVENYYSPQRGVVQERWRDLMSRKVLPLEEYESLFSRCVEMGMAFIVSVYDIEGAEFARSIGAAGIKIASANLVNQPLIDHISGFDLPMIIDTGKASLREIARAVEWAQDAGARELCVEHSPLAPPAPVTGHNLRMLTTFRGIYDLPVGLSDHHAGTEMLLAATALGASVLEKGVCADADAVDQDVTHALPIGEVTTVLRQCLNVHCALGDPMRHLAQDTPRHNQRMGLVAKRQIQVGDRIDLGSVDFAWPAIGIPVENWDLVRGWVLKSPLDKGVPVRWSDVVPDND